MFPADILPLILLAFLAAIVRGYSGFGFSAIAVTAASIYISPAQLVPVLYLLEIAASIMMIRSIRSAVDWRLLGYVLGGCLVALPVGQYLLVNLPEDITRGVIYCGVLICATLVFYGYKIRHQMNAPLSIVAGVLIGLGSGIGSIGGLPAMVIFLGTGFSPVKTRALFVMTFLVLYLFGSVITYHNGLLDLTAWSRTLWLVLPTLIGIKIGERLFARFSASSYRQFALGLMIILSLVGLVKIVI